MPQSPSNLSLARSVELGDLSAAQIGQLIAKRQDGTKAAHELIYLGDEPYLVSGVALDNLALALSAQAKASEPQVTIINSFNHSFNQDHSNHQSIQHSTRFNQRCQLAGASLIGIALLAVCCTWLFNSTSANRSAQPAQPIPYSISP